MELLSNPEQPIGGARVIVIGLTHCGRDVLEGCETAFDKSGVGRKPRALA
jgi:hypothetical protein